MVSAKSVGLCPFPSAPADEVASVRSGREVRPLMSVGLRAELRSAVRRDWLQTELGEVRWSVRLDLTDVSC